MDTDEQFDRAAAMIPFGRFIRVVDRNVQIAFLIRHTDWRPLTAPWWRGKEVCIVGADLGGNFFLRHCDGSVRYWDHRAERDIVVASSIRAFVSMITNEDMHA